MEAGQFDLVWILGLTTASAALIGLLILADPARLTQASFIREDLRPNKIQVPNNKTEAPEKTRPARVDRRSYPA